jgi:hypothetical protein
MQPDSNIAFKEWAVVVEALGQGEQMIILRKGGIHEERGQFHADHREFWLFPTQFHEAERSIIPSKHPVLRSLAATALKDLVDIQYYAVVDAVLRITDSAVLARLQGHHIWNEQTLHERFEFGREPGLNALLTRVYRRPAPVRLPLRESYGGCKSWLELEQGLSTEGLTPVLADVDYNRQGEEIRERLTEHALADS